MGEILLPSMGEEATCMAAVYYQHHHNNILEMPSDVRLVVHIEWPDVVSEVGSQEADSEVAFRGQVVYQQ